MRPTDATLFLRLVKNTGTTRRGLLTLRHMLKPENQRAIYDFLMKRDISQVDWDIDRPKTKAYIEMRNSSLSPCLKQTVGKAEERVSTRLVRYH